MPRFLADAASYSLSLGQAQTARRLFEAVCLLVPSSPVGGTGLAESQLALGEPRLAERAARGAARLVADRTPTALAYVTLARALAALGDPAQARIQLERAAEIDPEGGGGRLARAELEKPATPVTSD